MKKTALITGGSRGIGKAIALQLAEDGYRVLINFHSNVQAASDTLNEIIKKGGEGELMPFDVSDPKSIEVAFADWNIKNEGQSISILINNAGIRRDTLMVFSGDEQWYDVINTNLNSFYHVTRKVLQDMVINKFGRIVNIVSLSGIKGMPGQVNYSAAKAGVIGATKALAQEMGKKNITVNAVAPGFIKTDMTQDLDEATLKKNVPMNRFGEPEEVASLVAFLVSEKAGYITGEVISINGGIYT